MKYLLLILASIFSSSLHAQKEASHFFLDDKVHIDFSQDPPLIDTNGRINRRSDYGGTPNASIADRKGKLQFYTDGEKIYTVDNSVMKGGERIHGHMCSFACNSIIIPLDESGYLYYLFTIPQINGASCSEFDPYYDTIMFYHIIDMRLESGKGAVVSKNNPLGIQPLVTMSAVKHRNGYDSWIVGRKVDSNEYYAYLVTSCGITKEVKSITPGYPSLSNFLKTLISPNGKLIASMMEEEFTFLRTNDYLYIDKFDDSTGEITTWIKIRKNHTVGVSDFTFSPDSRYIFIQQGGRDLSQYNISLADSAAIEHSEKHILNDVEYHLFRNFQNMPNGKTMVTQNTISSDKLVYEGVFESPDTSCPTCSYNPQGLTIPKKKYQFASTPTYFMSSFFRPGYKTPESFYLNPSIGTKKTACATDSVTLQGYTNDPVIDSLTWTIEDEKGNIISNHKGSKWNIKLNPGKYTASITAWKRCINATAKITFELENYPTATINGKNQDTSYHCGNTSISFEANTGTYSYKWSNGSTGFKTETTTAGILNLETSNTCGTAKATVFIKEDERFVPNVISPNGDGINDTWNVRNKSGQSMEVKILNRWGSVVFSSSNYGNSFGNEVVDGVYFYLLGQSGGCLEKGWLEVIR